MKARYSVAAIAALGLGLVAAPSGFATPATASKSLPATLRPVLYRALARDAGPAYRVGANGCVVLPAQSLRGCFRAGGTSFASAGHTRLALHLAAYGRGHWLRPVTDAAPVITGNRVRYSHGALSEWWRVLPQGFEQGFTLKRRPGGHGKVTLVLASTQRAAAAGHGLVFGRLHYGTLVVTDARGRVLPATLTSAGKRIRIAVNDAGARYPLTVDPTVWIEQKLTASDGAANDALGNSVAFSGTTVVVGAPNAAIGGNGNQGAAYVFTESNGSWTQTQKLTASDGATGDGFGWSVAIDGTSMLVSAPQATVSGHVDQGAVYVFTDSGGTWTQTQKLTASDGATSDEFGHALAMSGTTALVGAWTATVSGASQQGAVYVFSASGSTWSQAQKLTASDGALDDHFGYAVALDGSTALIGAPNAAVSGVRQGAAYLFSNSGGTWGQTQKLSASDGVKNDWFGAATAVSGTIAFVGAPQATISGYSLQGAVYVYASSGGTWSQTQKLTPGDTNPDDFFGAAIAADGSATLIGAYGTPVHGYTFQGAAYAYTNSTGTWVQAQKITASDASGIAHFGVSVALVGMTPVIGAPIATIGSNSAQGAAYIYGPADLSLALNAPQSAPASSTYLSQAIATNAGTAASPAVAVTVAVPAAASFVSANATQGSCSHAGSVVTCAFGAIAGNGGSATANVTLKVLAPAGTTIINTASVSKAAPPLTAGAATAVSAANNPPVATNGSVSTDKNKAVSGTLAASDADNDPLTFSIVSQPSHGTVTITDAAKGSFTYTPTTGYAGSDSFTFKANDGVSDSNTATESVTIKNNPPVASNGSVTTNQDTAVNGTLKASDADNDALTFNIVSQPSHGTVTIIDAAKGSFTYTPASGYSGSDSFTFKANDGSADSNVATESITVNAVNSGGGGGGGGGGALAWLSLAALGLLALRVMRR